MNEEQANSTTNSVKCRHCGGYHGVQCPAIKAIEYYEDGVTVKRVEFKTAADYVVPLTAPFFDHNLKPMC